MNRKRKIPSRATESYENYYDDDYKAYIIDYYERNNLPLNGWIKPCINCGNFSSQHIIYRYDCRIKLLVSLCKGCRKYYSDKVDKVVEELIDKVENRIILNKRKKICFGNSIF